LHRIRERLIKNKVAVNNQMCGLLSEFGVVFPCGHAVPIIVLKNVIGSAQYSARLKNMMKGMLNEYNTIVKRVKGIETQLLAFVDNSQSVQILRGITGIGIINASAFLAAIDNV
jgi:transposase